MKSKYIIHPNLSDGRFIYLFLKCDYVYDPLGYKRNGIVDFKKLGESLSTGLDEDLKNIDFHNAKKILFSETENKENTAFLKSYYEKVKEEVLYERHSNQLIKKYSEEARKMLKKEKKEFQKLFLGTNYWKTKEMQMVLFYKYIYINATKVFKEGTNIKIRLGNLIVEYDYESYFHIHRHYAQIVKPDNLGKSYFTEDFHPDKAHTQLQEIFTAISENLNVNFDEVYSHYFKYKKIPYAIHFMNRNDYVRVSTFYPIENQKDRIKLIDMDEVKINNDLTYLMKQ